MSPTYKVYVQAVWLASMMCLLAYIVGFIFTLFCQDKDEPEFVRI